MAPFLTHIRRQLDRTWRQCFCFHLQHIKSAVGKGDPAASLDFVLAVCYRKYVKKCTVYRRRMNLCIGFA
jgi:hypothetical protein